MKMNIKLKLSPPTDHLLWNKYTRSTSYLILWES